MLPTKPNDLERQGMVYNIVQVWHAASQDQYERGKHWYRTANEIAGMIASGDTRKGAGVIAALSANKRWSDNVTLATSAMTTGTASGHMRDATAKAQAIMDGAEPEHVLPMSIKTGQFYRCISNPSDTEAVVIDRHAHDIAAGERYGSGNRGLQTQSRYDAIAQCYRQAAETLGVLPSTVQAVTWTVQVESQ